MHASKAIARRRARILKAARICFLDRGFVKTTISDIVAISGGSRATVYAEFGSKEGLFVALIRALLEQMKLPEAGEGLPDEVLGEIGVGYLSQLLDPEALALYRVAIGESAHVRALGSMIFDAGPGAATATLADRLRQWNADRTLDLRDPDRAAAMFIAMLEGDLHRSALMWRGEPTTEAIANQVDAAVALFLSGARSTR
jgi:TetR/AcrR family transcriptional regulator, mexJK operon transcriptional repressor